MKGNLLEIKVNGNLEKALKLFKNRWEKSGIKSELMRREYYQSRGQRRRRKKVRDIARYREKERMANMHYRNGWEK